MQLSHLPKTSDHFGRYYTDKLVAQALIKSMDNRAPKLIMDLGVGGGALVSEASRRWSSARFVTVDIDRGIQKPKLYGTHKSAHHHIGDALANQLSEKIGVPYGSVDAALCNPPYINPKWRKHFGEMLEEAGLSDVVPKLQGVPADILFLAQNLRFLRSGGKLGLILPDGVISGQRFSRLRSKLASEHRLERIIELPRRIFRNTDAKAHIVVLSKNSPAADEIRIQRLGSNGVLSAAISLESSLAGSRLDYSYLESNSNPALGDDNLPLRDFVVKLSRGKYSSADLRLVDFPVFHTTDFPSVGANCQRIFELSKFQAENLNGAIAHRGDILLARVGRNLEQKICVVNRGYVAVSDSVFVLKLVESHRKKVLQYLCSDQGRIALASQSRGVGAQFLTAEAVLSMPINL